MIGKSISPRLEIGRRHRTERYLVADAERNQTIQPGGVARSAMNDIAFLKKKSSKMSAVLTGYAGVRATVPDLTIIAPCHKWPLIQ